MIITPVDHINRFFRLVPAESVGQGGMYFQRPRPVVKCKSGLELSIQASASHYCHPRVDGAEFYTAVEIGFPPYRIGMLMDFAEDKEKPEETVYAYTPTDVVNTLIDAHGGIDWSAYPETQEEAQDGT